MKNLKIALSFAFIFFLKSSFVYADGLDGNPSPAITDTMGELSFGSDEDFSDDPSFTNNLLDFIYGAPVKNGFIYLPFGMHTKPEKKEVVNNALLGVVHNSLAFGTFVNSFNDRTWYFGSTRNIVSYNDFGLDYFAGLMYGYKGQLSTVPGIPLKNTFLFSGKLNPVVTISAYYEISDRFQVQALLTPLVVLTGIKYNF